MVRTPQPLRDTGRAGAAPGIQSRLRTSRGLATALLAWAVAAGAALLPAQTKVLDLDPAKTSIEFTLPDVLHTVHGSFRLKRGTIRFDPAGGPASGSVVVDATSGDSGSKGRDRKMHEKVLESRRYPEITFTPTRVDGAIAPQGESRVQIHGLFGLHGAEHEIAASVVVAAAGDQWTATIHFAVPYVEWGLKNPSTFVLRVGGKVDIDLHATGRLE